MEKTITLLEIQKNNPNRINVYLDDEFAFGISRFVGTRLKQGDKIGDDDISILLGKDTREKALQKALRFISYRPRSSKEVQKKLEDLGFSNNVVEDIINELEEKKYLNDREFAENWIGSRISSKPRSREMLSYELRKKNISSNLIDTALGKAPENKELALSLGKKYLRRYARLEDSKFREKMTGVLARRLFPFSIINPVINELLEIRKID